MNKEKIKMIEKRKKFLVAKLGNKFNLLFSTTKKYL